MAFPAPSLTGRALKLLSMREHSRRELERKLARFEEQPGSLATALDNLQAKGFISEARVIASVIHRRASKFGAARIRQELFDKGLERDAVDTAIGQLRVSDEERAREIWRKRFGTPPADANERARQSRFLSARGFGGEVIHRVLTGGYNDE